jgi:hypothetical protein
MGISKMTAQHHLAVFLGEKSMPIPPDRTVMFPGYDPVTQLQRNWSEVENYRELLCSGEHTGDPNTMSSTTAHGDQEDPDTDDSGE